MVVNFTDFFTPLRVPVVLGLLAGGAATSAVIAIDAFVFAGRQPGPQVDCWIEKGHGSWSMTRNLRKTKNGSLFGGPRFFDLEIF